MKTNPRFNTRSLILVAATLGAAHALVSMAVAQIPLPGARPSLVAPRPVQPVQLGTGAQNSKKQPPPRPSSNITLVNPGPIGLETTTGTFALSIPSGGTKLLTATAISPGDPLRQGWGRVEIAGGTIYFAHVPAGQGWTTLFTVMNTGSGTANWNLVLTGQDGQPLRVRISDLSPQVPLPFRGDRIEANGPPGIGGVATFQFTEGGSLRAIAGVLASQPVEFATIPVDDDDTPGQDRFTGFAIANPSNENVTIKLATVNESAAVVDDITPASLNPLGPGRQVARFLFQELPARAKFRGSMVLRAQGGGRFVVVALVQNRGLFTAIPVVPEKAPTVPN